MGIESDTWSVMGIESDTWSVMGIESYSSSAGASAMPASASAST